MEDSRFMALRERKIMPILSIDQPKNKAALTRQFAVVQQGSAERLEPHRNSARGQHQALWLTQLCSCVLSL
jgi:hypothetical protein